VRARVRARALHGVVARDHHPPTHNTHRHTDTHTGQQNGAVLREGDWVSINGTTGEVIKGQQPVKKPGLTGDLATFMKWVDAKRRLKVLTNADTPEDAKVSSPSLGVGML
jgi:phosphoenolpyruvate synthase/pyruvate phosphate dikinase